MRRAIGSRGLLCGAVCAFLAAAACNGNIIDPPYTPPGDSPTNPGDPASPGNAGTGGSSGGPSTPLPPERTTPAPGVKPPGSSARCDTEVVTTRVLRRLTNVELEATIRAAFGLDEAGWKGPSFVPDPASGDGFTNNTDRLGVGDEYAKRLMEAGKDVADQVTSAAQLVRILPCSATAMAGGDVTCATTFVDTIGKSLFRRPLLAAERERYLALYRKVRAQGNDFKAGIYWLTVGLIKSPNTVYRSELGDAAGTGKFKLSPYEVASELAYAFTGGPPPADLLALAAAGRLATADDLESAARGLIYMPGSQELRPAFRAQLLRFVDQWLGLSPLANINKDATLFADFTPEVQDALAGEVQAFVTGVLLQDKGKPADLMTAPFTYLNATLARFYGFGQTEATGDDFVRVQRPANWGAGLVSQGAILAIAASNKTTSPTKRGHLVRERFLCTTVPPPPAVVAPLPEPTEAETTRQRYEKLHVAAPECKGCHALMDNIGFGLEHLDTTGRYRATEGRFDIDDSGVLAQTSAGDLSFKGGTELARALGQLPEVADCMADFASAYAFGLNHAAAGCVARSAGDDLRAGKIGFVDFLIGMARAESFRTRTN
jgi:hypothetical protein